MVLLFWYKVSDNMSPIVQCLWDIIGQKSPYKCTGGQKPQKKISQKLNWYKIWCHLKSTVYLLDCFGQSLYKKNI